MGKYIIIVHVYDVENSQAYPLGGLFGSQISAYNYLMTHVDEVKNNHWTKGRTNEEEGYDEGATPIGWNAQDMYSGQSIEIEIHAMKDEDYFEVCSVNKGDIEKQGFDASKMTDEDMTRIASHMDNLIREGCDYWTALDGACEYWEVPKKRGNIRDHLDDILRDDETANGGVSHAGETLRRFMVEADSDIKARGITLDDDVSVLNVLLKECGIMPIEE